MEGQESARIQQQDRDVPGMFTYSGGVWGTLGDTQNTQKGLKLAVFWEMVSPTGIEPVTH